ncbi:MAG: hypothetical protein IEMM0008_0910 [bacterium]|nr:MAG: hypothetical protein IEMM0008_0910 [bacterium]
MKDYKRLSHRHRKKVSKTPWYRQIDPKPYLAGMAFVFLGVLVYSWYQKNNPVTVEKLNIREKLIQAQLLSKKNPEPGLIKAKKKAFPQKPRWKYIIIHHSATDVGDAKRFNQFHLSKYHHGLLYHFIIGNGRGSGSPDGKIEIGYRWKRQIPGGSVHGSADQYNQTGIAICLVGNFTRYRPTKKQMNSLYTLTRFLMKKFSIPPKYVLTHRHAVRTICPGPLFPEASFTKLIQKNARSRPYQNVKADEMAARRLTAKFSKPVE